LHLINNQGFDAALDESLRVVFGSFSKGIVIKGPVLRFIGFQFTVPVWFYRIVLDRSVAVHAFHQLFDGRLLPSWVTFYHFRFSCRDIMIISVAIFVVYIPRLYNFYYRVFCIFL
jgi:hypothetical protein